MYVHIQINNFNAVHYIATVQAVLNKKHNISQSE